MDLTAMKESSDGIYVFRAMARGPSDLVYHWYVNEIRVNESTSTLRQKLPLGVSQVSRVQVVVMDGKSPNISQTIFVFMDCPIGEKIGPWDDSYLLESNYTKKIGPRDNSYLIESNYTLMNIIRWFPSLLIPSQLSIRAFVSASEKLACISE